MDKKHSSDPRSVRARSALQEALKALIQTKPYQKITITDIADGAGLSRHTFYNHYETKEELLNSFLDEILDQFFTNIGYWDLISQDPDGDLKIGIQFFQVWKDQKELIKILKRVDLDRLMIDRLQEFFRNYYYNYAFESRTGMCEKMAQYVISFNAYSWAGILRQWFDDDMDTPPELLGNFLNFFVGIKPANNAIKLFNEQFRQAGLCKDEQS